MRILTIAPTPFFSDRGSHIRIYSEAKYLQKQGAEVLICTYHIGKDVGELNIKRIKKVDWYTKTSPGFSWGKLWVDLKLIWLVKNELKKFQPSIIHAHNFEGLGVSWFSGLLVYWFAGLKIKTPPIVLDLQGDLKSEFESYNKEARLAKKFFVWVSKWLINKSDKVVVSSENALESTKKIYKNPDEIKVIGDGVDLDLFSGKNKINVTEGYDGLKTPLRQPADSLALRREKERPEIKAIKKWKKDSRILIYTGGMVDSKGVGRLLKEFIKQKPDGWKFLLFGEGKDRLMYVHRYVHRYVHFCKYSGYFDLPDYLNLADVAIDPKKDSTESSGKLVNYMVAGLPVVCFNENFNRSMLGENGFYLNNIGELESVLKKMKPDTRINYEIERLSEKKEVQKLHNIFESILKN